MKKSLLVLALLFLLVSFAQSPVDKSFPPEELFALGSYYYPEQWDSSQWERDQVHPFCGVCLGHDRTGRRKV